MTPGLKILLYLTAWILPVYTNAQAVISGRVLDSLSQPVEMASVIVRSCNDDRVLAFCNTDQSGNFSLKPELSGCDTPTLHVRSLGYNPFRMKLSGNNMSSLTIRLSAGALNEIVIRAEALPVVVRSDTTEYSARAFSDSTEFSVEDLLKKIPGIQVDNNGRITVGGKSVEKVMIEGDDLFNQNYTIGTRNIRADMIDKIQAIDRYQDNPLFKGISESERMVLNLTIREDKKYKISGSTTTGAGFGGRVRGQTHINLISITRKSKSYILGNANNTGNNALESTGASIIRLPGFDGVKYTDNPLVKESLYAGQSLEYAGMPAAFSVENKSALVFGGYTVPVNPKTKLKLTGWTGAESLKQEADRIAIYRAGSLVQRLSENTRTAKKASSSNIQADLNYSAPNQRQSLQFFLQYRSDPLNDYFSLDRSTTPADTLHVDQNPDNHTRQGFAAADYSYKVNSKSILQIIARAAQLEEQQTFNSTYNRYFTLFHTDSSFTGLKQPSLLRQSANALNLRFLTVRSGWNLELTVDAGQALARINSSVGLLGQSNEMTVPDTDFRNDIGLRTTTYRTGFRVARSAGNWQFRINANPGLLQATLRDSGFVLQQKKQVTTESAAKVTYFISRWHYISVRYGFTPVLAGATDYLPGYIVSDYQTFNRGLPQIAVVNQQNADISYNYHNARKFYGWSASLGTGINSNVTGSGYQINPDFFLRNIYRPVSSNSTALNGSVFRFIPAISSRFEVSAMWMKIGSYAAVNDVSSALFLNEQKSVTFKYGSAFDGWFNAVLSMQWTSFGATGETGVKVGGNNLFSTVRIHIKPDAKTNLKLDVFQTGARLSGAPMNVNYGLSGTLSREVPAWRSTLMLSAMNLLFSDSFGRSNAWYFYETRSSVRAVTPYIVFSWDFHF